MSDFGLFAWMNLTAFVAIPGIHVLMGYFRYCGSFVLQPQCVACSVAGVIS